MSASTIPAAPPDLDLAGVEARALAEDLAAAQGRAATPFGTYLLSPGEPAAELARQVERAVFGEVFGNRPALLAAEYAPYEATTAFVCVLDHRRARPVGAMRLILPGAGPARSGTGAARSKSLDDLASRWGVRPEEVTTAGGAPLDLGRTWDLATVAVAPGYHQGVVSLALHQACCTTATRLGAASFVTVLDVAVLRRLQVRLGRPFAPVEGAHPRPHLGSPASVPCTTELGAWAARLARRDPVLHEALFLGRGLEAVVSPPDWDAPPAPWLAAAGAQAVPVAARDEVRPTALSSSASA